MNLSHFPQAIATTERTLLGANQAIRKAQAEIDQLNATIDSTIAHDEGLKNDAQRKVRRFEMMRDPLYQECLHELQDQLDNRSAVEIELNLLRNQFSVAKLQIRESIALRELQLESAV